MTLLEQFQGKSGKRRIFEIFNNSELVKQNNKIAKRFTDIAQLSEYEKGDILYSQGEHARGYLYLVLTGKIDLIRNGIFINSRETGQILGEFPFINPSLSYTVNAICKDITVIAKISEDQFQCIANDHLLLWKNMSVILVNRLNIISNRIAESKGSRVFIGHGHSKLWIKLKYYIHETLHLEYDEFNRESAAGISITERLTEMLQNAGLAFLIFTAEDEQLTGEIHARMNVIHEAGLFQGRLGFKKAIILIEEGCKDFSNIYGLNPIPFPKGNIEESFDEIKKVLIREGLLKP